MEPWGYICGDSLVSDESVSAKGGNESISKDGVVGCDFKYPWSYDSTMMCSSQEIVKNQEFIGDILGGEYSSSAKLSISNSREFPLIDLELEKLSDNRDGKLCSLGKRTRGGGLNIPTPYCQVNGCKKDLSSSKDYYKRHKVCEIHSKSPTVIVNGIEQRFCQQCSRFHLLNEFDDSKRSCRKRLADHNERRRKPKRRMHGILSQLINGPDRALSLLSSQSQSSSNHSSGIQSALPLITSGSCALYPPSYWGIPTMFHSSLLNSKEESCEGPTIVDESAYVRGKKNQFSCEDGSTISWSQLQRVEHSRQSLVMIQEDNAFSGLISS